MKPTDNFRRQHRELLELATGILSSLDDGGPQRNAAELRRQLARLAGKIQVHARMENEALYPRLLEHSDPDVRAKAEQMWRDFGPIYDAFTQYLEGWPDAGSIERNSDGFVEQTRQIFDALGQRIAAENRELYDMADRALA